MSDARLVNKNILTKDYLFQFNFFRPELCQARVTCPAALARQSDFGLCLYSGCHHGRIGSRILPAPFTP